MTDKHAVDDVVTNLNLFFEKDNSHSEPVRKIPQHLFHVETGLGTKRLPLIIKVELQCGFKKSICKFHVFLVQIALKILFVIKPRLLLL